MAMIGYARVSTAEQTHDLQTDALSKVGCERVFTDVASGAAHDRPQLAALVDYVREGDILVVWRLDRLGRSLPHLLQVVEDLAALGVGFKSITEAMDTTTSGGRLIFSIFGALAEFERNLIKERTQAGLAAARAEDAGAGAQVL